MRQHPNLPSSWPVPPFPVYLPLQPTLALLGWAYELLRDSITGDEAGACCRAEAARTVECLCLLTGTDPRRRTFVETEAHHYLATIASNIREGGHDWSLMQIAKLRHAWG